MHLAWRIARKFLHLWRSTQNYLLKILHLPYRKLIQSLICLCNSRPNISYAIGVVSKFSNKPCQTHWKASMPILEYVKGTIDYGILYEEGSSLVGYCDSDWARDIDTKKLDIGN
ncbi:hypothetical protein KP509_34G059600 [Ceratopteris richardii]|uniref:Uncharacterized protein n=1 Tax=Ceratopteris richardii TaxID=49495 RepID=A0A8T2QMC1_CERRI|nr:hypothetical protein KP509_34G059600 [Ceratopteris richardii]